MSTAIHDPIAVGAIFERSIVRPVWFIWRRRRYEISEVTMRWVSREGETTLLHLGVTDGANLFELVLNQRTLVWSLAATEAC